MTSYNNSTGLTRVEQRLQMVHDEVMAYAGTQQRFTKRSKVPDFSKWQIYELLKEGMSPEDIGGALRFRYPVEFSQSGPNTLLTLLLTRAHEEYINSNHTVPFKVISSTHGKN